MITGENLLLASEVHAKLVNMDQFYAGPITPTGHANPSPLMHAGYGIQVGTNGKRFVPETWLQVPKAKAIAERTPDNRSFMLIGQDADANDNILSNLDISSHPFRDEKAPLEQGLSSFLGS